MPDTWHAELLSGVAGREIELEVAIFLGIRRQVIGPDRDLAPLEALADVPDRLLAGPPRWEVAQLSIQLAEPLSANPFVGPLLRGVTVGAGEVELSKLARAQRFAAL